MPTYYIYAFVMTITLNVHYFPSQYSPVGLSNNEGTVCAS